MVAYAFLLLSGTPIFNGIGCQFGVHHEPMAQRQRVGFQTRRLGVQIPLGSSFTASRAPLAERSAVNRQVLGSIPSGGAFFLFFPLSVDATRASSPLPVLVAQLDKASDYESEDWGFKSLQGYAADLVCNPSLHGLMDKAHPS